VVNFLADLFPGGVYDVASNGEVQLEFKPPVPGKSYLIDCKVDPVSRYEVTAYPGAAVQIFQNTHHLPVVYTQAGTEWIRIRIERDPPGGWVFYSCEVTMID